MFRAVPLLLLVAAPACGDNDSTHWPANSGPPAHVVGHAFIFGPNDAMLSLAGATVAVAEAPSVATTVAADGSFEFDVPSGGAQSFLLTQDGFHPTQSAAIDVGTDGIARLGFQVPTEDTFGLLGTLADVRPDPMRCQVATTVSRLGTEPYGGDGLGVEGATAALAPGLPSGAAGPIYFAYANGVIYPDPSLTQTSLDGGVIFANVPIGDYTLTADKAGTSFSSAEIRCRAGVLVNAAPPNGLQQLP